MIALLKRGLWRRCRGFTYYSPSLHIPVVVLAFLQASCEACEDVPQILRCQARSHIPLMNDIHFVLTGIL